MVSRWLYTIDLAAFSPNILARHITGRQLMDLSGEQIYAKGIIESRQACNILAEQMKPYKGGQKVSKKATSSSNPLELSPFPVILRKRDPLPGFTEHLPLLADRYFAEVYSSSFDLFSFDPRLLTLIMLRSIQKSVEYRSCAILA
jgi:hypothetical protein